MPHAVLSPPSSVISLTYIFSSLINRVEIKLASFIVIKFIYFRLNKLGYHKSSIQTITISQIVSFLTSPLLQLINPV